MYLVSQYQAAAFFVQDSMYGPLQSWPGVSIVLPLKGLGEFSIKNWETQLHQVYGEKSLERQQLGIVFWPHNDEKSETGVWS